MSGHAAGSGDGAPVKVVYVLGSPRCGSTLICNLLGELDGFFAAGEIRLLWQEVAERGCGCGLPATECPVWSRMLAAVEASGIARRHEVAGLLRRTSRMQDLPGILRARTARDLPAGTQRLATLLGATYRAVASATGARVIVDSSKSVAEAALLRHVPEVDPYVVHLVRDPRAMVHSWHRALAQDSKGTPARPTPSLALRWVLTNTASQAVGRRYGARAFVSTYERLVRSPEEHLAAIAAMVGEPVDVGFLADPDHERRSRHIVGGNALRKGSGRIRVEEDREWQTKLPVSSFAPVTVLTLPLLRRYGYPLRRPAADAGDGPVPTTTTRERP